MSGNPTIVVSGLGRCGSSLVMQMLHAGGVPCVGSAPDFEDERAGVPISFATMEGWAGMAVKVLDPHRMGLPGDVRVIWLDRDTREQARSQIKFLGVMLGLAGGRAQTRSFERLLVQERPQAMRVIGNRPLCVMTFEQLLANPSGSAAQLAAFVGHAGFNTDAAAKCVLPRSAKCHAGMDVEASLLNRYGVEAA